MSRGLSNVVAGLMIAIAVAGAMAFVVGWVRQQAMNVPAVDVCRVYVYGFVNGSNYVVYVVNAGGREERVQLITSSGILEYSVQPKSVRRVVLANTPITAACRGSLVGVKWLW